MNEIKTTAITLRQLRNVFPAFSNTLREDDFFQVVSYDFPATFRRDEEGRVTLAGGVWGTLDQLMNTTVIDCKLDNVERPTRCDIWVTSK